MQDKIAISEREKIEFVSDLDFGDFSLYYETKINTFEHNSVLVATNFSHYRFEMNKHPTIAGAVTPFKLKNEQQP